MKQIHIVLKTIGDFKDIITSFEDYNQAKDKAKELQEEIHSRGYTDFRVIVISTDLNQKVD